ncbi:MAG: hypothetical protein ACRD2D_07510, partial [Terriglobales bacterium]
AVSGDHDLNHRVRSGRRWETLALLVVLGIVVSLALIAHHPAISVNMGWVFVIMLAALLLLVASGTLLWRRTRFS